MAVLAADLALAAQGIAKAVVGREMAWIGGDSAPCEPFGHREIARPVCDVAHQVEDIGPAGVVPQEPLAKIRSRPTLPLLVEGARGAERLGGLACWLGAHSL